MGLATQGYQVLEAPNGKTALELLAENPALIILDLGLPDIQGHELLRTIRGRNDSVPVVVLSSRGDEAGKVQALDLGADDYVTKPFGVEELLARMRAAARRTGGAEDLPRIKLGDLIVDLAAKRVIRQAPIRTGAGDSAPAGDAVGPGDSAGPGDAAGPGDRGAKPDDIRLTPTEWHLLEVLLRNPGKLLSRNQLLTEVWGPGYADATGNLRLYMAQLRRKLEPDPARPRWLITEPGMGYRYQPSPDAAP
jgi:two-component system, OmpR family, KDP operon response regulator KdpE